MLIRLFRIVQFSRSFPPPFRATWLLYHISADLSRGFLKFFKKLFSTASRDCCLSSSLYIVSLSFDFVKGFFKLFWNFLDILLWYLPFQTNLSAVSASFRFPKALLLYHHFRALSTAFSKLFYFCSFYILQALFPHPLRTFCTKPDPLFHKTAILFDSRVLLCYNDSRIIK